MTGSKIETPPFFVSDRLWGRKLKIKQFCGWLPYCADHWAERYVSPSPVEKTSLCFEGKLTSSLRVYTVIVERRSNRGALRFTNCSQTKMGKNGQKRFRSGRMLFFFFLFHVICDAGVVLRLHNVNGDFFFLWSTVQSRKWARFIYYWGLRRHFLRHNKLRYYFFSSSSISR